MQISTEPRTGAGLKFLEPKIQQQLMETRAASFLSRTRLGLTCYETAGASARSLPAGLPLLLARCPLLTMPGRHPLTPEAAAGGVGSRHRHGRRKHRARADDHGNVRPYRIRPGLPRVP